MQQVTIHREPGRYGGWPNHGIWAWGDEVVVGFTLGYYKANVPFQRATRTDPSPPCRAQPWTAARPGMCSLPWAHAEQPRLSADEHMNPHLWVANALDAENAPVACPGGINFTHPDFAMMCAKTGLRAGVKSWFYVSYDRCKSWEGPYWLPMFGQADAAPHGLHRRRAGYLHLVPDSGENGQEGPCCAPAPRTAARTSSSSRG